MSSSATGVAAGVEETIDFQEVYELLKANLAGANDAELKRAATAGLLGQLSSKVQWVDTSSPAPTPSRGTAIGGSVYEHSFGYLRLGTVGEDTPADVAAAYAKLVSTNQLKGLVLDLRFAGGTDYAAAAAIADQFIGDEKPLVDWGEGLRKSHEKTNSIPAPVTILVNRQTSGAAEVLAGILRQSKVGLLIGTNSAGRAHLTKEFTLKTGQRLRIATGMVQVGDHQEMPAQGLKADIQVGVASEEEKAWIDNSFRLVGVRSGHGSVDTNGNSLVSATNRPRQRVNESELVRLQREGQNPEGDPVVANSKEIPTAKPLITDPALARAIDLLKGLTVVRQFRAN